MRDISLNGHSEPSLLRQTIAASDVLRADVIEMRALNDEFRYESDTPRTQVVFPVAGLHYIGTGPREVLLDLNQVAFIPRGIITRDRHPSLGDVVCIVVTPSPALLDEVWHGSDADPPDLSGDTCPVRPIEPGDQIRAGILATRARQQLDGPCLEETLIAMLRRTARHVPDTGSLATSRSLALVAGVKELLATTSELLSLGQIAKAIGASPAYLTDLFHKVEGMPIYRYQTRLRLARALGQLPYAEDITDLALELGFSSHSHFSSTFRSTYGMTPSAYRATARRRNGTMSLPST